MPEREADNILTINGGSSSIKFALYKALLQKKLSGKIDKIGLAECSLTIDGQRAIPVKAGSMEEAATFLMQYLVEKKLLDKETVAVHRIVHGMHNYQPQVITTALLNELKSLIPYDPDHLPGEIALIEAVQNKYPQWKQIACFDTAFHRSMPRVASQLPIPRRFDEAGIKKYGFHGISYTYIMSELERIEGGDVVNNKKIILAHLGNGASMAAVKNGKSIDTTMGFTPAGGLVMSTRSGDIDPGIAWYMMQHEHFNASQFNHLINHESGLTGVSGISSDMQELLSKEHTAIEASEAVAMFCYHAKKWIGALTATLSGLDILVFTGGIGENAATIRTRICAGLGFLGIIIDENLNERNATTISNEKSNVKIYVMPTDEEYMMAKMAQQLLSLTQ